MLHLMVKDGKRVSKKLPPAEQLRLARENMVKQLETLDDSYKRILNPHIYKVSLTEAAKDLKMEFINARIKR
jgi:nicotinate phosphoribosyltransferase